MTQPWDILLIHDAMKCFTMIPKLVSGWLSQRGLPKKFLILALSKSSCPPRILYQITVPQNFIKLRRKNLWWSFFEFSLDLQLKCLHRMRFSCEFDDIFQNSFFTAFTCSKWRLGFFLLMGFFIKTTVQE